MINWLKETYEIRDGGLYRKDGFRKDGHRIGALAGKRVGWLRPDGYRAIMVMKPKKKQLLEHRAIWLMVHGYEAIEIDHIDGDKTNNDPQNLREVTSKQNKWNRRVGIRMSKKSKTFLVTFQKKYIGYFKTEEEAIRVRAQLEQEHYGAFAPHR